MAHRSHLRNRVEWLGTCATIAIVFAMSQSDKSFAQAFQGTPTVVLGNPTITTGATTTTITVGGNNSSATAVINWATLDRSTNTPIDFLPAGRTATFTGPTSDFVVFNRVFAATPGQAVSFNGTVLAQTFAGTPGGSVWFYSPGGIIAGPTSVFNVGNLILTADDIDTTGGLFGPGNLIRFRGAAGSTSAVTISPTAQLTLPSDGSYLALVGPQVNMGGTATVNGSVAYVAAEQVDMAVNNGFFNISFLAGTDVTNALIHSGTTTGPSTAGGRIAMAAMPKNTAITMLVSGNVGYTPAATAGVYNGAVVLSGGQNLVSGGIPNGGLIPAQAVNLNIGTTAFTSRVDAVATNIFASPTGGNRGGGTLSFSSDARLTGFDSVEVRAEANETVTVGGNLTLNSARPGLGGKARLAAIGPFSTITIGGTADLNADGVGVEPQTGVGGNGVGGMAEVFLSQGNITVGSLYASANGYGAYGPAGYGNGTGGAARIHVEQSAIQGGLFAGITSVSAAGFGGEAGVLTQTGLKTGGVNANPTQTEPNPGNGVGGTALIEVAAGGQASLGDVTLNADGVGGSATADGTGGDGSGGTASIDMAGGSLTAGTTTVSANSVYGLAGPGGTTGRALGTGVARVSATNATASFNSLSLSSNGTPSTTPPPGGAEPLDGKGDAQQPVNTSLAPLGPIARGSVAAGQASLTAGAGSSISIASQLYITAGAQGTGPYSTDGNTTVTAGASAGGTINVTATNGGQLNSAGMFLFTSAFGSGATTTPGNATGGTVNVSASNGGVIDQAQFNAATGLSTPSNIFIYAQAAGGAGGAPSSGTGGAINVTLDNGSLLNVSSFSADDTGYGGASLTGGAGAPGLGGVINLTMTGASVFNSTGIFLTADGASIREIEGFGGDGIGSSGIGGTVNVSLRGGTLTTGTIDVSANGRGALAGVIRGPIDPGPPEMRPFGTLAKPGSTGQVGAQLAAGPGGIANGGTATFTIDGTLVTADSITVAALGIGGGGADGNVFNNEQATGGGSATGGNATLQVLSGGLTASQVTVDAEAYGGEGGFGNGVNGADGGNSTGGRAQLTTNIGATFSVGSVDLYADGYGGGGQSGNGYNGTSASGGNGGDGRGGTATAELAAPILRPGSSLYVSAEGYGGQGGTGSTNAPTPTTNVGGRGGDGFGGDASIRISAPPAQAGPSAAPGGFTNITVSGYAAGGYSGYGDVAQRGGDATGGTARLTVDNTTLPATSIDIIADAEAGTTRAGRGGAGARGGDATGGLAQLRVVGTDGGLTLDTNATYSQSAIATATDGTGGATGTTGSAGGRGGNARGGTVEVVAENGTIDFTDYEDLTLDVTARGGNGGNGGDATTYQPTGGGTGGDAGSGVGGTLSFYSYGGNLTLGNIRLGADGTAGSYGYAGVDAGRAAIPAVPGTPASPGVPATPGTPASPAISPTYGQFGAFAVGQGGTVQFLAQNFGVDGTITVGDLTASTQGHTTNYGDYGFAGNVSLRNENTEGGAINFASVSIDNGPIDNPTSGYTELGAFGGNIAIAGNLDISTPGYVYLSSTGTSRTDVTGSATIEAGGFVQIEGNGATTPTLQAGSIDFTGSSFESPNGYLKSLGALSLTANFGGIRYGGLTAQTNVLLSAPSSIGTLIGGAITATTGFIDFEVQSADVGQLTAGTGIGGTTVDLAKMTGASAGGTFDLDAGQTNLGIVNAQSIAINSGQGVIFDQLVSRGTTDLTAGDDVIGNSIRSTGVLTSVGGRNTNVGNINGSTNVSLTSTTGITVPTLISGGTTVLSAANGAITVGTNLQSAGNVTASGRSLFLRSTGSLAATTLVATAGVADIATGGALSANSVSATGNVILSGTTGLTVPTVTSGGTTSLTATNGAVTIATNLQSTGLVTAAGRSILLRSTGGLTTGALNATAGNVDVQTAGALSTGAANATGAVTLSSINGALSFTTAQSGSTLLLSAGTTVTGNSAIAGTDAFIGNIAGGNVTLTSLQAGGNANVRGSTSAATLAVGTTNVGGYLEARGAAINFGNVSAGTDAILSTYTGGLTVGNVTAGDDIFLTVNGSNANANTVSPDSQTGITSTTQFALNAGNLLSTGQGSDTANSGPRTFQGAGPTGNVIRVRASGAVTTGTINTSGNVIVASDLATITTQAITGTAGVAAFVRGNANLGNINSNGVFWLGDSSQLFVAVPGYQVSNFPFFQTPTNGNATLGTVSAAGIRGTVVGSMTYTSLTSSSFLNWTTGSATTIGGSITGGALTSAGAMNITAGRSVSFTNAVSQDTLSIGGGTGTLSGLSTRSTSSTSLSAAQALTMTGDVTTTGATGSVSIGGSSVSLRDVSSASDANIGTSGGDLTARNIAAAGGINLSAIGGINLTSANATGNLTATATNTLTAGTLASGATLSADAANGISVGTVQSMGASNLTAANGTVLVSANALGAPVNATGRTVSLFSQGNLNAGAIRATAGDINLSANNNLTGADLQASGRVLASASNVNIASIGAGGQQPLVPTLAQINGNTVTLGNATVSGNLQVNASTLATLNGTLRAGTIQTFSRDIAIGSTAQVGVLGTTTSVSLTNIGVNQTFVGGSGTTSDSNYRLTDAELQRVFANNISVIAAPINDDQRSLGIAALDPAAQPDLILDTLTLAGGTNLGSNGTFTVQARSKMRVTGTITLTGLTSGNTVRLRAPSNIEATPTSSIVLRGANGLAGTLRLDADDVIAASSTAYSTVAGATTVSTASDRLGANDGTANDGGYFQAGGIIVTATRSVYIQNSGSATTNGNNDYTGRRGFTVGSDGFTIVQASSTPLRIAVNGRQVASTTSGQTSPSTGGFITGTDVIPLIKFVPFQSTTPFQVGSGSLSQTDLTRATGIFDAQSTVNGCVVVNAASCRMTVINDPTRDVINGDFGKEGTGNLLPFALIQLSNYNAPTDEPLIDEPVTGSANDDLWSVDDNAKCDPAKDKCEAPR